MELQFININGDKKIRCFDKIIQNTTLAVGQKASLLFKANEQEDIVMHTSPVLKIVYAKHGGMCIETANTIYIKSSI